MTVLDPNHLPLQLRIAAIHSAAEGLLSFELEAADGGELPAFTPGAHLRLRVPNGALRKYSLCNDPAQRQRYVITVQREASGQGGSLSLCDSTRVGDSLVCALPENAFALAPLAKGLLFIAGGIGITPIMSMIRSFGELAPAPWKLIYLTRSAAATAFRDELSTPAYRTRVKIHHDQGDAAKAFDLWPLLERPNTGHLYCCGPKSLMDAVRDMTGHWTPAQLHFESFVDGDPP